MSTSPAVNPLSYNWNTIYVKYCDGASFSGNNDTTQEYNSTLTLHWRGWRILNGVFKELDKNYKWSSATDVLISGCSAVKQYNDILLQQLRQKYVQNIYQS